MTIRRWLKELLHTYRNLKKVSRMELASGGGFRRPALIRKGFFSKREELYPFDRFDVELFLTDWEIETRLGEVNGPEAQAMLTNKLFFHYALRAAGLDHVTPRLVGTLEDGRFRPNRGITDLQDLLRHEHLIVKPLAGGGGEGVRRVAEPGELPRQGMHLLEGVVDQHAYAATIFPDALNTMRVLTMRDDDGVFCAGAAHRFGTCVSSPVDNFKAGGIVSLISLESGRLSEAVSRPGVRTPMRHAVHPDTGAPIEGTIVPDIASIVDLALDLAERVPGLWFAGWDLCITPVGPVVIEGNAGIANPNVIQAHQPLLQNDRVLGFLERHGVVGPAHSTRIRRRRSRT